MDAVSLSVCESSVSGFFQNYSFGLYPKRPSLWISSFVFSLGIIVFRFPLSDIFLRLFVLRFRFSVLGDNESMNVLASGGGRISGDANKERYLVERVAWASREGIFVCDAFWTVEAMLILFFPMECFTCNSMGWIPHKGRGPDPDSRKRF